ncbi:protein jim lovell isoform X2 [Orussus abietinus]|uniref:protein jim lovell isoform X2 n=1 Tax=Orussus abietinus TaxID=222816 RepID=UPI000625E88D|nr:protein jim lovell isoform X2 [Orussus abietinus]
MLRRSRRKNLKEMENLSSPGIDAMESHDEEDSRMAELVLSNKGGPKLIHNGFMYTLHKKQPHNIRWRCVGRASLCRGSLITTADCKKPKVRMDHNHKPDFGAVSMARKRYIALGRPRILPVLPTAAQATSSGKTIRIATQSLVRPQMRNIAPAPVSQQQQQQLQPKTLVLKTIPLKVKQVAPTTIKMPPRQTPQGLPQTVLPQQPTEVCLRWNSYHSNMQNSFPSLLDSEQFVDVTLACEGRSLKCHKMILSSCSDYLAELLRENPCQHPIILMKDLKFWEVEALVKFMYRGEVNVAHDKLPQLLNAAEALQVKGLAGPSPSSQNPKPPMLIPQAKPQTSQPVVPRVLTETKEVRPSASAAPVPSSPKRAQKRHPTEPAESRPFTKIRLQRPRTPTSPSPVVKLEPLDIPLSPTEIFPENNEDSSNPSNFDNLMSLHEDDDPGGDETTNADGDINFCEMPGPPDLQDGEDQMEFVPTDFLEQGQDILEEVEAEQSKGDKDDSVKEVSDQVVDELDEKDDERDDEKLEVVQNDDKKDEQSSKEDGEPL